MEQGIDVILEDEEVEVDAQTDFLKGDKGDKGDKGNKGDKGDKGDTGEKGDTGYTPVKGIDYYTDNELQAIIQDITSAIEENLEPQEQERQLNEQKRQSNEQERTVSENARIEKETDRQASELTRISNEEIRQNNENMRETKESEREETENRRMETFTQMQESVANAVNNIVDMTEAYNNNATAQTNAFNENATEKTNEFNSNAETKISEYNANVEELTNRLLSLEADNTTNKADIENIKQEQTTQDTNIQNNTESIEEINANAEALANRVVELETENEILKNQIPEGQAEGANITLNDSAEMEFKELKVSGNSWQETRDVTDEEGTVIGAMPSPEFPSEIRNVGDNVNIFDGKLELGIYSGSTGNKSSNDNYVRSTNFIPVKELTNYKFSLDGSAISVYVYEYKEDYSYNLTAAKLRNITQYLTTESGTKYITFRTYAQTTDTTLKIKIEKGTKITPYSSYNYRSANITVNNGLESTDENYQEQVINFPLSEGQRLMLGDYLADDGVHHKRGQVRLSQRTSLSTATVAGVQCQYIAYPITNMKPQGNSASKDFFCDRVKFNNGKFEKYAGYIIAQIFVVLTDLEDTIENVNSVMEGAILEYPLAEEIIESYTEEQQIVYNQIKKATSYKNITHIFSTDEISPVFDVTYRKDLETLFNNVNDAILGGN